MASLLKNKKDDTIEKRIESAFLQNSLSFLAFSLCFLLLLVIISRQYQKQNASFLALNNFYTSLQMANTSLYTYALSPSQEAWDSYLLDQNQTQNTLEEVKQLTISSVFSRDIRDIEKMLDYYCSNADLMFQIAGPASSQNKITRIYMENQSVYRTLNGNFHQLYTMILEKGSLDSHTLRKKIQLCIAASLLFFLYCLKNQKRQARAVSAVLTCPIRSFTNQIQQFKITGIDQATPVVLHEESTGELHVWAESFNEMIEMIHRQSVERETHLHTQLTLEKQRRENLEIKRRIEQFQYQALQSQINPHFLFNTLNMLAHSARIHEDPTTAELLGVTARLLRYSLDFSDKSVTLEHELSILEDYIYIQKQRFGSRIRFLFDFEEEIHRIRVPSLILQPLLENSISHGLGTCISDGIIQITTRKEDRFALISIRDNGAGMDGQMLQSVCEHMRNPDCTGNRIGLKNIFMRLSIFFREKSDIQIISTANLGTEVTLFLPLED